MQRKFVTIGQIAQMLLPPALKTLLNDIFNFF